MTMALRVFLSVLCPDCNSVCRLCCDKSWRVCQDRHHSSAVTEPRDPISCENCFLSYRDFCVLHSGKSDLLLAFAQRHGVILCEILGKGGGGGLGVKPPT